MGAQLFAIAVTILIAGVVWFFVVRPILEDYGIIRPREGVNHYPESDTDLMSRAQVDTPPRAPSSLQTDGAQTPDRPMMPVPSQEKMLDIFRALRAAGIKREAVSIPWRAAGLPFDNNLWAKAAPDDEMSVTPIAGRPTPAKFHDDPELEYQPLR